MVAGSLIWCEYLSIYGVMMSFLMEHALEAKGQAPLRRLPSHNAFWFGWHAAFPNTELVR